MIVIPRQKSMDIKKDSLNEFEKIKVPAELKKLAEDGAISMIETSIYYSVFCSHARMYLILYRFARDFDIELV